ncbi:hypothetical protein [Psychroserpens algicola]|uniref:Lipoprotein n=1 Tax=Psychroserpens algicola TaxID=1719034 RepID=A0ABT0HE48_9FLAO|nr:hypothetical protein [Psychroserpens algicola]MCK8482334.1 hypothetical protein [Psychroserpens algicola]
MKNILLITFCFLFFSCGAKKEILSQRQDIYDLIKNDVCEISLPEDWVQVFDVHKFLYLTPRKFKNDYIKNRVSIFRYFKIGEETLESVADQHLRMFKSNYKIVIKNKATENTKFGETLIYNVDQFWSSYHLENQIRFFKIDDNVYVFSYKSFPEYFKEYLPKADFIYENLVVRGTH